MTDTHTLEQPAPYTVHDTWSVADVLSQQVRPDLSEDQAVQVLDEVEHQYDADSGVNWDTLNSAADRLFPRQENAMDRNEDDEVQSEYKVSFGWNTLDVQELRPDLDDLQASEVLDEAKEQMDASVGFDRTLLDTVADRLYPARQQSGRTPSP